MAKKSAKSKDEVIHIHLVLDRSGSMNTIKSDVIGGFNSFLAEQKAKPGKCLLTLIQFNSQAPYDVVYEAVEIGKAVDLTDKSFVPDGLTPLYDAMGRAIASAGIRADKLEREGKPAEKVLFVTFTDGLENLSQEYNRAMILAAIEKRQAMGWTFVYLGANQDAFAEGSKVGYQQGSTRDFAATGVGTRAAFATLSTSTASYRASGGAEANANFFENSGRKSKAKTKAAGAAPGTN